MEIELFKEALSRANQRGVGKITGAFIAQKMHISRQALWQKVHGNGKFSTEQQKIIVKVLRLSKKESTQIFGKE